MSASDPSASNVAASKLSKRSSSMPSSAWASACRYTRTNVPLVWMTAPSEFSIQRVSPTTCSVTCESRISPWPRKRADSVRIFCSQAGTSTLTAAGGPR